MKSLYSDKLKEEFLESLLFTPINNVKNLSRSDIIGLLLVDINRTIFALDSGIKVLQQILSFSIYLIYLILIGKFIAIAFIASIFSCLLALSIQRSNSWELGKIQSRLNYSLQKIVGDGLYGLKTIRSYTLEEWLLNKFSEENKKYRKLLVTIIKKQSIFNSLRDGLFLFLILIIISFGNLNIDNYIISTLIIFSYKLSNLLTGIIDSSRLCTGALPGYKSLIKCRKKLNISKFEPIKNFGNLIKRFEKVDNFKWESSNRLLQKTSLKKIELSKGGINCIKGRSGIGKSTLMDLIFGLISAEDSTWTINKNNKIYKFHGTKDSKFLKSNISYLPQNDFLFEASLYENLILKDNKLINSEMKNLTKYYLEKLGLSYLINEKNMHKIINLTNRPFSSGELKRLCIIRNILNNKPIEFYDEPTSFLDTENRNIVENFLKERSKEKIVLVISHDDKFIEKSNNLILIPDEARINFKNFYK